MTFKLRKFLVVFGRFWSFWLIRKSQIRKNIFNWRLNQLQIALANCSEDLSQESLKKLQTSARNITDELMDRYKTRDDGNIKAYPDSLKKFAVSLHMKRSIHWFLHSEQKSLEGGGTPPLSLVFIKLEDWNFICSLTYSRTFCLKTAWNGLNSKSGQKNYLN